MTGIYLEQKYWQIVQEILIKYPYKFYAFGSRVKGTAKKFSDLDLCYKESIPLLVIANIEEDFVGSDLPFKVDLIDWHTCSDDFKQLIGKDLLEFNLQ